MADLARAVLDLAQLVSPRGHDHPEIAEKIDEVQDNLRRFAEAQGRSLLELRREIEAQRLRRTLVDVVDRFQASQAVRDELIDRLSDLEASRQADTLTYTRKLASLAGHTLTVMDQLGEQQEDEAAFLQDEKVQALTGLASQLAEAGAQYKTENELQLYRSGTAKGGLQRLDVFGR